MKLWLVTALLAQALRAEAPERPQIRLGEEAPAFELTTLEGDKVSGASLRGAPAVLFFAATWCSYSKRVSKAVQKIHKEYQGKGVRVLLVNILEARGEVEAAWRKKRKLACPIAHDPDGAVARAFAPPADVLPETRREDVMPSAVVLLDAGGRIRHFNEPTENPGLVDWKLEALRRKLDGLLAAPPKPPGR